MNTGRKKRNWFRAANLSSQSFSASMFNRPPSPKILDQQEICRAWSVKPQVLKSNKTNCSRCLLQTGLFAGKTKTDPCLSPTGSSPHSERRQAEWKQRCRWEEENPHSTPGIELYITPHPSPPRGGVIQISVWATQMSSWTQITRILSVTVSAPAELFKSFTIKYWN